MHRTVTPPTILPVLLEDVMEHLRLDPMDEAEHAVLSGYLAAATRHIEAILNRPLLTTVMETILPAFPFGPIELHGRVLAVESITYLDGAGVEQTVDPATYRVSTASEPGRIYLSINASWPPTLCAPDAIRIRYTSGYGSAPSSVPEGIRHAVQLLTALWFENRVPVAIGSAVNNIPFGVECLIAPHKLHSF